MKKLTSEEWINKAKFIHNDKYDYSKSVYVNTRTKICIICPIHGEFWQTPESHLQGRGCKKCSIKNRTKSTSDFIIEANKIHNNKYLYDKSVYIKTSDKIIITCPEHGDFMQTPNAHLSGRGCPICRYSKGEKLIHNWLKNNHIKFKVQYEITVHKIARNSDKIILDFFVKHNNRQYFIEYDGKQHYEYSPCYHYNNIINFKKQVNRDKVLNEFCELHKDEVELIRFNYLQSSDTILKELNNILNK